MKTFLECWASVAADLLAQALAGEPELTESLPKPFAGNSFGFAAAIAGDVKGRFAIILDASILETPLVGEGIDQKVGWAELVRETINAAAGEFLSRTGKKCHVESFETIGGESKISQAFQLRAGDRTWTILVRDEIEPAEPKQTTAADSKRPAADGASNAHRGAALSPGLELLLDVELEASLRFGSREMPLGDILELGPGDVVQLDRQVTDSVDLIVGDKIVARGDVVLVNGNFGLRVTEVSTPRKRLEGIRCLF